MSEELEFVTVATLGQVPPGRVVCVDCSGTPVSLANVDGSIYAFAAYCTHQLALLEEGELDGTAINCPWHAGSFDVVTGRVLSPPPTRALATYPVQLLGNDIQLSKSTVLAAQ
jgi:nitrite reductase/ring-hydroxylating ferredoxin subunit